MSSRIWLRGAQPVSTGTLGAARASATARTDQKRKADQKRLIGRRHNVALESAHSMAVVTRHSVTGLLAAWAHGDREADEHLMRAVYADLRRVARNRLRAERLNHSLAPTALVHEAYVRLVDLRQVPWQNRAHFFAIAARVMRQVLVDHARAHEAAKRGGGDWKVTLAEARGVTQPRAVDLLDLDVALDRLAAIDGRLADLVVLRFFGGLTIEETAESLDVSPATVKRDWMRARAWLFRELQRGGASTGG
jgi:RNA polymerase sigma factor (TIGR02999 family)